MRGYGTKLVWNSLRSTFSEPSKRRDAVIDETTVMCEYCVEVVLRGHTLSNETVEVLVVRSLNTKVTATDIINGLIVNHERTVRVLQGGVGCEDGVVWLNDSVCNLRGRVDRELELALLAIVDGQTLHKKSTETRTCATAK